MFPWASIWLGVLLLSPLCGATFMLPEPQSSSLIQGVGVSCEGEGSGCAPAMNVSLCVSLNVCELSCQTRSGFPDMQLPLSSITPTSWTRPANSSDGCQVSSGQAPEGGPSSADSSNGLLAINSSSSDCTVATSTAPTTSGRLALALWLRHGCTGNCTVARIGGSNVHVFLFGGKLCVNSFCDPSDLTDWTHLVLMISNDTLRYAVNGTIKPTGGQAIAVPSPTGPLSIVLGVTSAEPLQTGDSYELYDVRYYTDLLTFREIQQVYTNKPLQDAGTLSQCRCPFSHLTLTPGDPYSCQNETGSKVSRLNVTFHSIETLTDGNMTSAWTGPASGQFELTVNLTNVYQVEMVEVGLKSSVSGNLLVILPNKDTKLFVCNTTACSINLSLGSQNVSPQMLANRVMRQLKLNYSDNNPAPRPPVALSYITVTGRCNCHGNAARCNMSVSPYVCDCSSSSNTEGEKCQKCQANRFRQETKFVCQGTCDCNVTGTVNSQQTCLQIGGACQCKPNVQGMRCDICKSWTHSLNASNPLGCEDCACNRNGSVSCDQQSGSCTCKNNVAPPRCDQCLSGFYDVGPLLGQDVCQPCGCDFNGTLQGQLCDNVTGQCPCKDYVEGRTCSECKDGYYSLKVTQSKGCLPCICNKVGSASHVCHKVTGQCPCQGNGTTGNMSCSPRIVSIDPRYGPQIGGTLITIRGQLLGNSSQPPSVFLGNFSQFVKSHNLTTVVVETLNHSRTGQVSVKVSWQSEPSDLTSGQFTYMPNPVLLNNSIPDVAMFVSGGCGVPFKGSNFRSVAVPRISVTDQSGVMAYSNCRHVQQDLQCITPDLSQLTGLKRSGLTFGLQLDGLNFSSLGTVQVLDDPKIHDLGNHDFQYPFETSITISGSGLKGGCSQGEVSVLIGVVNCDIVSFSASQIECEPPQALQGTRDQQVVVRMGSHISKVVGTLNYLEVYETTYFIGIMCGVGGLILLILIIVIFCCCRRRCGKGRPMRKRPESQRKHLMGKPVNGTASTPNQYTELSMSGAPSTDGYTNLSFQDPVQQETVIRVPSKDAPVPSVSDVDAMSEFLNRVESSLWDSIRSATISTSDLKRGNVCTTKGEYARIIDGHFSTVRGGQRHEIKVTIKTIKENLPEGPIPMWATAALRECLRLHRHGGDNVLSMMGLALDKERFSVIYPYMQNRTLKDHIIDGSKEFSVRQLVEYGLQVADGLSFLSAKDLVHKDLATRNCWVDSECMVKIADSALAWDFYGEEYVYDSARERHMPIRWMAPESLSDGYYDMRTDVWSLGVVLWELLTRGCLPFHEVEDGRVKEYILEGYLLGKPENCSDHLYEVMKECWNLENEHRPHVTSLVKLLGEELTGDGVQQDDIYVNLGSSDNYYENQNELNSARRQAPPPPS